MLACVTFGFLALIAAAGTTAWSVLRTQQHSRWVQHSYEVERRVSSLRVLIERQEAARRAYLLARRPSARATFQDAVRRQPALIGELRALTRDNPVEQANIDQVERLTVDQFHLLAASIALADRDPAGAIATFDTDHGRQITSDLRDVTAAMLDEENRLLAIRAEAQRQGVRALFVVLAVTGLLALVVALFSIGVLRRYTRGLVESREAIARLNEELEDRVEERTRDLARANEEIQRFAYIVSHDLRAPLVNVMGFTGELEAAATPLAALVDRVEAAAPDLLGKEAATAAREDLPEAIRFIRASTQKMDRLINAILRLSREGKRVLVPERLDLAAMIDGIIVTNQHRLDEIGATITVHRPMPTIQADRLAVEQMLSNLIENAVKYLKPGVPGRIALVARADSARVEIDVADNGRGVDPRDHGRIFDLFRRSGAQDQPGEGIGLAHVRALAYRLGGFVTCRSALGEGATFTLSLPLSPIAPQGQPAR